MGRSVSTRSAARRGPGEALRAVAGILLGAALIISSPALTYPQARDSSGEGVAPLNNSGAVGNLSEQIPSRYRERYKRWKATFLSAETGHQLWQRYAANPAFRLTIIVSKGQGRGAKIDSYQWSEGRLVAATIILGHQLDQGYPGRTEYPVLGSLLFAGAGWEDEEADVLAAAKIAHEFGHVDHAANSDATTYQVQNMLSQVYNSQWRSNGRNADDPVLTELAGRMGGAPITIFTRRERQAETYALRYLLEKLTSGKRRRLLKWVRRSLASDPSLYYPLSQTGWGDLTSHE